MRDYRDIPAPGKKPPRDRLAKGVIREDEAVLCAFGNLAYKLGFESIQIHKLIQRSADREIARDALLRARNPKHYSYNTTEFDAYIDKIVDFFNAASRVPELSVETTQQTERGFSRDLPNRSGLPRIHDHIED